MSKATRAKPRIPPALVDDFMDAYLSWRQECEALRVAYRRWSTASTTDRAAEFARFSEKLEREERACEVLAGRTSRVRRAAVPDAALDRG
jgi:hypothetical protein